MLISARDPHVEGVSVTRSHHHLDSLRENTTRRMSLVRFSKMHGLGNDFMVVDTTRGGRTDWPPELIHKLSCRHTGVGFDQLLLICPSNSSDVDFNYRIINTDGYEAGQCGNGVRCLARFVRDNKLTNKDLIRVQTVKTLMELRIEQNGQVTANMGEPILDPERVPFVTSARSIEYTLDLDGSDWVKVMVVSMGNPHAVMVVDDVHSAPVKEFGPKVQQHPCFPEQCNVGFMQVVSPSEIKLRVCERSVGETLACGSGACAAVVAGRLQGLLDEVVTVHFHMGDLQISWQGEGHPVMMTGPATHVYDGEITV